MEWLKYFLAIHMNFAVFLFIMIKTHFMNRILFCARRQTIKLFYPKLFSRFREGVKSC